MVAIAHNGEVVSTTIRPLFASPWRPKRLLGIPTNRFERDLWVGEPVPATTLIALRAGRYNCSKSTFAGIKGA